MGVEIARVAGKTVLPAHLTELAGPISQHRRGTLVGQAGGLGAVRLIISSANEPTTAQLVITRGVKAEGTLLKGQLLALAPDEFTTSHQGMVDGTPQRPPAQGGVDAIKLGQEVSAQIVVSARIGQTNIEIG